ncbi:MAG: MFS transporter [Gemmatimonadaceae bacterium]|nr:MFS transporter [Gemmatimonadaceae bacterium]
MSLRSLPRNVIALSLVSFFTDASSEMIYPLIPAFLATVLGASALSVGAIEGTAETVASLLKFGSGWWSDRLPKRKPLVVAGYAIASLLRPLMGIAQSVTQVFAIRVGDRIGKGIRSSPRDALIADSVAPGERGRAFGFHRASDHLGAVVGPLLAFVLLQWVDVSMRVVFLLAAIPAAVAMLVLVLMVREDTRRMKMVMGGSDGQGTFDTGGAPRAAPTVVETAASPAPPAPAAGPLPPHGRRFYAYLAVLLVFTLGNSTDAFLLLRATDVGVPLALIPLLWSVLHVVKAAASTPSGKLSDRLGRRTLIVTGWLVYAAVYLGFAAAGTPWHIWALFLAYGVFFGLTEGAEKALVADLVPTNARGRAFGWYNLSIGLGALPASVLFGALWDRWGAPAAFTLGAGLAGVAALGLLAVVPSGRLTT